MFKAELSGRSSASTKLMPFGYNGLFSFFKRYKVHKVGDYGPKKVEGFVYELNNIQAYFYDHYNPNKNALVLSPTGTGKTDIAIIAMNRFLEKGEHIVYLAPTKAIIYQKLDELLKYGISRDNVTLRADRKKPDDKAHIVITTAEGYMSSFRQGEEWAVNATLVVSDEIHNLFEGARGMELDSSLTLSMFLGKKIVGMTGTLPDYQKAAAWISMYRKAELFINDVKPVRCNIHKKPVSDQYKLPTLKEFLRKHHLAGEQTLVFVPTKKTGYELSECLEVPFHCGELTPGQRSEIESKFISGIYREVITTTTLAEGVNLPADCGFLYGSRLSRGKYITNTKLNQMIGRIGRFKKKKANFYILGDIIELFKVLSKDKFNLLLRPDSSVISLLSINNNASFGELYGLSQSLFCALQSTGANSVNRANKGSVKDVLKSTLIKLDNFGVINCKRGRYSLTANGMILSRYYLNPSSYVSFMKISGQIANEDVFNSEEKSSILLSQLIYVPFKATFKRLKNDLEIKAAKAGVNPNFAGQSSFFLALLKNKIKKLPNGFSYNFSDVSRWLGAFKEMNEHHENTIPLIFELDEAIRKINVLCVKERQKKSDNQTQISFNFKEFEPTFKLEDHN